MKADERQRADPRSTVPTRAGPWACALLALAACGGDGEPGTPGDDGNGPPNLVLVIADTFRADHLEPYGYARRTTPVLSKLASRGVVFERAYASSSWTKPAVASILTGRRVASHGLRRGNDVLAEELETLAERLARQGYNTAGIATDPMLGRAEGFAQGFSFWHEEPRSGEGRVTGRVAAAVAKNALAELEGSAAPFFLMVHLFDPHWAYATYPAIGFAGEPPERLSAPLAMTEARELLPFSDEELAWLVDAYDEEVWITDRSIGELLGTLEVLGERRNTLVVVVGDHGEEFGERGRIGHVASLHEEVMHVPLLVSGPGLPEGKRVAAPVSVVSLAPTLLELLGLPDEETVFDGPSLAPLVRGGKAGAPLWPTARVHRALGGRGSESVSLSAVVGERYKLIRDLEANHTSLFDLQEDPGELRDLSAELPDVVQELERHLEAD